jgi:hypothetical protein
VVERSDGSLLTASRMTGSATSNDIFAYSVASTFTLNSITTSSTAKTNTSQATISAVFNIFVSARGGDIYIAKTGAFKVFYSLNDILPGAAVTSVVYSKPSSVTSLANSYRISEGKTATFKVNATYVLDGPAGSYNLRVAEVDWGTSEADPTANKSTYMAEDYVSESKFLQ